MRTILIPAILITVMVSCNDNHRKNTPQTTSTMSSEKTVRDSVLQKDSVAPIAATKLQGIDISHHQSDISWDTLKLADISFIFIKATGGMDYTDPEFAENWKNAKQAGLMSGAYHFYYSADDPAKQSEFFSKTVLAVSDPSDLPPVLDVETHGVNSDISVAQYQNDVKKWLELTEKAFGKKPIIYTSKNFADKYLKNESFGDYHLWLAEYEVEAPVLPETWTKTGWTFWQYSYLDTIPGIKGNTDHNIFNGDLEALKALGD